MQRWWIHDHTTAQSLLLLPDHLRDKKSRKRSLESLTQSTWPALVWRFCDLFPEAIGLETLKSRWDRSANSRSPASAAQVSLLLQFLVIIHDTQEKQRNISFQCLLQNAVEIMHYSSPDLSWHLHSMWLTKKVFTSSGHQWALSWTKCSVHSNVVLREKGHECS